MALLYLISFICALWINTNVANTLDNIKKIDLKTISKKNFDVSDISDDPAVIEFVCEQVCSDHNSGENENYSAILVQLAKIQTQLRALTVESRPPPSPETDLVPREYKKVYPVYILKSSSGNYRLSLQQARERCREDGSTLATRAQLEAAFQQGMDFCSCGWLEDGYAAFPIQYPRDGCFASQNANGPGVRTGCTWQRTWNAWCFNKEKANKGHTN